MTKKTQKLKEQISKLQEKLKIAEAKEKTPNSNWIKIGDYEIEKSLHTEMHKFSLIKIPENCELLTFDDLMNIWNNHRDKFDFGKGVYLFDEVVKQPIKDNETAYPFWNVWLHRLDSDDRSGLYGDDGGLCCGGAVRGVRFKRKVKK